MRRVDIITMGCSKNLVDSEQLIAMFERAGFKAYHDPDKVHGDIAIINTCGFIASAKEESINQILRLCQLKEDGFLKKVIVMGCLSQRYQKELEKEIPQVDKFYGKFNWKHILQYLNALETGTCTSTRTLTTPGHYAYVKIAEGCDRHCAYCAIPLMTGRHKSRPLEEIIDEVRILVKQGVKEFQIIEQELTYYGVDLYKKTRIAELIEAVAQIPGVEWLRLHYAYPNNFPEDLLRVIRENKNVCNYLDIALQHISDRLLSRMQRHVTKDETIALIKKIRREVPGIALRTTLLVGFPGETEADFEELLDFVRTTQFERLGVFAYSEEEGTFAANNYKDDVPETVKQQRIDRIMQLQRDISSAHHEALVGSRLRVIIDRREGDYFVGRSEFDSPDVDGEVYIKTNIDTLKIGQFCEARITAATDYDLYGDLAN